MTLVAATVSIAFTGCVGSASTRRESDRASLSRVVEQLLARDDLSNSIWGIEVFVPEDGRVLYARNPGTSFVPASNTKLYTTAAALDQLGPDFVYRTPVLATGTVEDGTLNGDLVIRGSGDPTISGRFTNGDRLATFREWAARLKEAGIRHISGNIVGDDNLFDDLPLGYGWSWDDAAYWYSAEVGALTFNDNCVDFTITARRPGESATITWEPANTAFITVDNETVTLPSDGDYDEKYFRGRASNNFVISSHLESGRTVQESLSVHNPTAFFVYVLRSVLVENGISVDGYAIDIDDATYAPTVTDEWLIFEHQSPPLSEIVTVINKRSHNLYAEQVIRSLRHEPAMRNNDELTTAEAGIDAASATWTAAGVDTSRIQLVDGSGLSRYNLVTPGMTSSLLAYMWTLPDTSKKNTFLRSLPIGGVDGSIGGRFRSEEMRGRVRAKTGTVSNVSSLSGYVDRFDGGTLGFSIMANNFTVDTDTVRAVQDQIVTAVANWGNVRSSR